MKKITITLIFLMTFILLPVQGVSAKDTMVADTGFRVGKDGFGFEN